MEPEVLIVLSKLIVAHLLTDFLFQPDKWVENKRDYVLKSDKLYFHAIISGLLSYVLLGMWNSFFIPIFIMITHFIIDAIKANYERNRFNNDLPQEGNNVSVVPFLIDQSSHFIAIIISCLWIIEGWNKVFPQIDNYFRESNFWIVLTGFILITYPFAKLVSILTEYWRNQLSNERRNSLAKAGLYIGIFERILVLIFILLLEFEVIGFLIAAKSILRFSSKDQKEPQKQTEYVLVGTFISFTLTIILGLLMKYFVN